MIYEKYFTIAYCVLDLKYERKIIEMNNLKKEDL